VSRNLQSLPTPDASSNARDCSIIVTPLSGAAEPQCSMAVFANGGWLECVDGRRSLIGQNCNGVNHQIVDRWFRDEDRDVGSLPHVRGNGLDRRGELSVNRRIDRSVPGFCTCWVLAKEIVAFPVPRRPDWSWNKPATAVGTHVFQDIVDAGRAKGALVAADTRFE
jgi:hypothetical protein